MIYLKYDTILGLEYWIFTSPYYDSSNSKKQGKAKPAKGSFKTNFVAKPKYRGSKHRESEDSFAPKNIKNWDKSK